MYVKKIGEIAVDSGSLLLTDPQYLQGWSQDADPVELTEDEDLPYSFAGAMAAAHSPSRAHMLMKWVGAAFKTGVDRGIYPVFGEYNSRGELVRLVVRFLEDDPVHEPLPPLADVVEDEYDGRPVVRGRMIDRIRGMGRDG